MKKKIKYCFMLFMVLLLVCGSTAIGEAENYEYTYETAIGIASNDLSNIGNLKDAVTMLEQTGTYKLSRTYLIYFQQFIDIQSDHPDFEMAILKFELCNDMRPFVEDVEARGLPSCIDLVTYVKARMVI